jgi:solute carrier family 35 protein F5
MFFTLSSDYLYVLAMLKTTPLLVTVGLSLTIPLAGLADWLFLGRPAAVQVVLGGLLVLLSFVVLGVADAKTDNQERERREASDVSVYD